MKHSRVTFNLDLGDIISGISIPIKKTAKVLNIILMENGQPYEIEKDCKVVFYAKKPNGDVLYNDCIVKDNVVEYQLTTQTIALAGILECELLVYGEDSSTPIHSPSFSLVNYEPVFDGGEAIESTNEFTALTQAMGTLETLIDQAKDVIGSNAGDYIIHEPNYISSNTAPSDIEFGTHVCVVTKFDSTLPESNEEYTVQGTLEVIKAFDSIDSIRMYWYPCRSHNVYSRLPIANQTLYWSEWETAQSGGAGKDGLSAYEIWLSQGNTGSEADFLESLKGAKGDAGKNGTSVTIESISESTEDNGSNIVTFSDGNQMTIRNGSQGVSGVYVGDGEMPEGYNVQINPEGDISSGIEQEIIESNENILTFSPQTYTYQGVTYVTKEDGTCYISGTATSSSYHIILDSRTSLPNGIENGKKYLMDYYAIPIYARIQVRVVDSKGTWTSLIDNNFGGVFEIPQSAVGLQVRYYFGSTFKGQCFVKPRIFKEGSYFYNKLVNVKKPMPMLSIIYDDGHNEFYDYVLPLIQSKNIPIATAIIPDKVGVQSDKMTWNKITECYLKGAEILTHCDVKDQAGWDELGVYGVAHLYMCLKNALNNKGFNVPNALIFAGGSANYQTCREAAFKIFNAGFNASTGGINYRGILDKYNLNRYGTDNKSLSTLKGWIDDLFDAGTGWMVWTRHNSNASTEDPVEAVNILMSAIDYAIEKGIDIVTVERGLYEYLDI